MMRARARTAHASAVGARAEQQDAAACFATRDGSCHLLVVADGMGGHADGALAARTVIEVAARLWRAWQPSVQAPAALLETLCRQAHEEIRRRGSALGTRPHSTLVALLATRERAWWVHVGDSRLYGFRGGVEIWRTQDHTRVGQRVREGGLDEAAVALHPARNQLLRGLGDEGGVEPTRGQVRMTPDTGFVLCTDGFWAGVGSGEMAALLTEEPVRACRRWAATAAARGGADADNATVAVLRPAPVRRPMPRLWPLYAALAAAVAALAVRAVS